MATEPTILHSDLNCFYASVEMMLDPRLRGKAVAVCGATEDRHGIVLAKSELAKRAGVKTGMVNWEAKQRCPDLILVPPQYEQYLKYSKLAHEIYYRFLYGYSIKKGVVTINPEQAKIVQEIFQRFNDGESMGSIAADLNARNIKGVLGGEWCPPRIHDVVTNEKYLGNALLQKTFVNNHLEKKQVKNRGELPQYYAEGTHDAIIDPATFAIAQERIEALRLAAEERPKPTRSAF